MEKLLDTAWVGCQVNGEGLRESLGQGCSIGQVGRDSDMALSFYLPGGEGSAREQWPQTGLLCGGKLLLQP